MTNHCKNCKWWGKSEGWRDANLFTRVEDPDTYEDVTDWMPFQVKPCDSPKLLFYERPIESNGAAVIDGSRYYAALVTAENFGCVNFEPKG